MMEHLRCDFYCCCFVVLIQKRLLLNIHIGYLSVVTPSLGCLTLRFFDPHLKFLSGALVIVCLSVITRQVQVTVRASP